MDPHIEIQDEKAISLFLGKCVEVDGFDICPSEPVVVEHLKSEPEHLSHGCWKDHHGHTKCMDKDEVAELFVHGSCFKVDHMFICKEDVDHIMETMCVDIEHYSVCNEKLQQLF